MATQRIPAPAQRISRLPHIEGMGWMMLYVAGALVFLRYFLPLRLPGALLTLSGGIITAVLIGIWRTPRQLKRIQGQWLVHGPVYALEEATIGATLHAPGSSGPFSLEAQNPTTRRFDQVLRLRGLSSGSIFPSWSVRFPRRGPQRLPPLVARCDQPFGLLSSGREISPELDLLVLPAIGSVKKALYTRLRSYLELHAVLTTEAGDDELAQLRDYRPGDAPHSIHWRASARARTLLVAERHTMGGRHLALVVDCAAEGEGVRFERLLCAAATLVVELCRLDWHLTLYGAFAPSGVHGREPRLLEALALASSDARAVVEFVPAGTPALVLCLGEPPHLECEPRPLVLSLREVESLVHIPSRVR
jgi:uncharacterized protein (DUF58 family)